MHLKRHTAYRDKMIPSMASFIMQINSQPHNQINLTFNPIHSHVNIINPGAVSAFSEIIDLQDATLMSHQARCQRYH